MRHILNLALFVFLISCQGSKTIDNEKLYKLSDTINYSDFQIIYDDNGKVNYFSSIDSIFSKQYVNEVRKIKLILTINEKKKIYEVIKSADIFSIPDTIIESKEDCILPAFSTRIVIKVGQSNKMIYYSGFCTIKDKIIERRFNLIDKVIHDIIFNKEEVKKMPKSDFIYL